MKNWIKGLIGIAAAVCLLAGCGKEITPKEDVTVRVGSLKGPTSMGLLCLMEEADAGQASGKYEFTMAVQADELLASMVQGELDIALIPANVAGVLYQKTGGKVAVIDINTLGVLYLVTGDEKVKTLEDLKGRTIYLTGKGTTPDYVLHYILEENGISDSEVSLEYKSEASEVAALLAKQPEAVGLLPQPFATAACMQNEALKAVIDMNEEWDKLQGEDGSRMVTGVTVARKDFLEQQEAAVRSFLQEHEKSALAVNEDPQRGALLAVQAGIVAKEAIALKAIDLCNITCIRGEEMKQALSGYLEVLYKQNPESVGGVLPEDDFYYMVTE